MSILDVGPSGSILAKRIEKWHAVDSYTDSQQRLKKEQAPIGQPQKPCSLPLLNSVTTCIRHFQLGLIARNARLL